MSQEQQSEELVLTNPVIPVRSKPDADIQKFGSREIAVHGLRDISLMDYLRLNAIETYMPVAKLSRVFCGANTISGKTRVRRRLQRIAILMAEKYDQFLITETTDQRISSVKLLDPTIPGEVQAALDSIKKMKKLNLITKKKYDLFNDTLEKLAEGEASMGPKN